MRTAVVTGGSRGIGRAICLELAAAGDTRVVVAYREDAARAEETVAQLRARGAEAVAVAADVRSAEQVKRLADRVGELGGADVLVNNAGVIKDSLFAFMKEEDWRYVLDVDLDGAFRVTRSLIRGCSTRAPAASSTSSP